MHCSLSAGVILRGLAGDVPDILPGETRRIRSRSTKRQKNIYITYALNITTECDCDGQELEKAADDTGIFASIDPVAIDSACRDIINKKEGRNVFTGEDILPYAEKIGLGTMEYTLKEI